MQRELSLKLPTHLGFIIDGNRRWAKEHGLPTRRGHLQGYAAGKPLLMETIERGVQYVSAYVFSTENWKRAEAEVKFLMALVVRLIERDLDEFIERGIRIRIIGTRERLSKRVLAAVERAEEKSRHCTKGTVAFCFNYGGQQEIADACAALVREGTPAELITPEAITQHLYAPEIPPIDMVVRTSGEQRLSNFMLWRSAYSELLFLEKKWPDMTSQDLDIILAEYARRNRRFGGN